MARPQQPELARSAKTDLDPDHVETGLQGQKKPSSGGETGPVPAENRPGHHPPKEQDKPDLDAFAARLGADPKAPSATGARKPGRPKATPAKGATAKGSPNKTTPAKTTPAKTKAASRPAGAPEKKAPAGPPKVQATPAKRPAAAPTSRPQTAPSREDAAHFSVPQPEPDGPRESPIVGLMLMPLRETVKWLDQVERRLSERLTGTRN